MTDLTRAQFIVQMILAYARIYPGTTAKVAMPAAATIYKDFIRSERIEFGDPRYGWDASDAATLVYEYEGVYIAPAVADTRRTAPENVGLVSGVTSDPPSSPGERMREAAQAVIDRWDTPNWKDAPATAVVINNLRAAIALQGPSGKTGINPHGAVDE